MTAFTALTARSNHETTKSSERNSVLSVVYLKNMVEIVEENIMGQTIGKKQVLILAAVLVMLGGAVLAQGQDQAWQLYEALQGNAGDVVVHVMHNYHLQGQITVYEGDGAWTGDVEIFYKKPHWFKREIRRGNQVLAYGGKGAKKWKWRRNNQRMLSLRNMKPEESVFLNMRILIDLSNVLSLDPGSVTMELLDDPVLLQGRENAVLIIYGAVETFAWIKLLVDKEDHILRRVEFFTQGPDPDDYHEYAYEFLDTQVFPGNLSYPGRIREFVDSRLVSEIQVTSVTYNQPRPDSIFKPQ